MRSFSNVGALGAKYLRPSIRSPPFSRALFPCAPPLVPLQTSNGGYVGYLWTQGSPSTTKAYCDISDDVHHLLHCIPALPFGRTVADDHTIDLPRPGFGVKFDEPRLECGHEPLLWCVGRMCDQASKYHLCERLGSHPFSQFVGLDGVTRTMLRSSARLHDPGEFPQ